MFKRIFVLLQFIALSLLPTVALGQNGKQLLRLPDPLVLADGPAYNAFSLLYQNKNVYGFAIGLSGDGGMDTPHGDVSDFAFWLTEHSGQPIRAYTQLDSTGLLYIPDDDLLERLYANPNIQRIVVNLTGMSPFTPEEGTAWRAHNYTNREIVLLARNPEFLKKAVFYRDGVPATFDDIQAMIGPHLAPDTVLQDPGIVFGELKIRPQPVQKRFGLKDFVGGRVGGAPMLPVAMATSFVSQYGVGELSRNVLGESTGAPFGYIGGTYAAAAAESSMFGISLGGAFALNTAAAVPILARQSVSHTNRMREAIAAEQVDSLDYVRRTGRPDIRVMRMCSGDIGWALTPSAQTTLFCHSPGMQNDARLFDASLTEAMIDSLLTPPKPQLPRAPGIRGVIGGLSPEDQTALDAFLRKGINP